MQVYIVAYVESQNTKLSDSNTARYLPSSMETLEYDGVEAAIDGLLEYHMMEAARLYTLGFDVAPLYNIIPIPTQHNELVLDLNEIVLQIREEFDRRWPIYVRSIRDS